MKYVAILSLIFLASCIEDGSDSTDDMITTCLGGVAYWVDGENTDQQMMAPRIDPQTLTFIRCQGKK